MYHHAWVGVGILKPGEVAQWFQSSTANTVRTEDLSLGPTPVPGILQLSVTSAPGNLSIPFWTLTHKHTHFFFF